MSKLVQILDRFNRKERFCLLSDALVDPDELKNAADKIGRPFRPLNRDFRLRLQDTLELKSEIPEQSWWAFDYHLDWLFAALEIAEKCNDVEEIDAAFVVPPQNLSKVHSNDGRFTFNIEDCDLIVAFDHNIILVEAKVGPWTNSQLKKKMDRLGKIKINHVHYVLASPKPPMQVNTENWPKWAVTKVADGKPNWAAKAKVPEGKEVPFWIKLTKPPMADRWLKVSQCDADGEIREIDGNYWCVSRATT